MFLGLKLSMGMCSLLQNLPLDAVICQCPSLDWLLERENEENEGGEKKGSGLLSPLEITSTVGSRVFKCVTTMAA